MTRVVILAPDDLPIPAVSGGSVQIYLSNLVPELTKQPVVQAHLLSPGNTPLPGVRHTTIPARHMVYRARALAALRRLTPDVVQVENRPQWVPLVQKSVPNARVVLNLHSLTFLGPGHINRAAAIAILCSADTVTLNSRSLQRAIARKFNLPAAAWNPVIIHPGVPIAEFRRPSAAESVDSETVDVAIPRKFTAGQPLRLLYVGRVIRQKGVHTLITAVRLLRRSGLPVRLTIIGRTPPWERAYAAQVHRAAKGLPVRFLGFVPPRELPKQYWQADVFVCPSQRHEAFGLVNVEAMAAGLPVVASRQGGIAEIVDGTCGILVADYRNPAAFAAAIRHFYRDPALHARLAAAALAKSTRFTWPQAAKQFARVYTTGKGQRPTGR